MKKITMSVIVGTIFLVLLLQVSFAASNDILTETVSEMVDSMVYDSVSQTSFFDVSAFEITDSSQIKVKYLADLSTSGKVCAKISLRNKTNEKKPVLLGIAVYNKITGCMVASKRISYTLDALETLENIVVDVKLPDGFTTSPDNFKVYAALWDTAENIAPQAAGILIDKLVHVQVDDIIIDVTSTCYKETSGTTWKNSGVLDADGRTARVAPDTSSSNIPSCEWRPNIIEEGNYTVYVYKTVDAWYCKQENFDVFHIGGTDRTTVDYSTGSAMWVNLGTYYFGKGTDGYVKLSGYNSGTNLRAGTVKFVYED